MRSIEQYKRDIQLMVLNGKIKPSEVKQKLIRYGFVWKKLNDENNMMKINQRMNKINQIMNYQ